MAWTSPRTWVSSELVTASMLNTHLRDNLLALDAALSVITAPVLSKSGAYSVTTADGQGVVVLCTGTWTLGLFAAAGNAGRNVVVKNVSTGVITVDANASETIDGATTQALGQYDSMTLLCTGTAWVII